MEQSEEREGRVTGSCQIGKEEEEEEEKKSISKEKRET